MREIEGWPLLPLHPITFSSSKRKKAALLSSLLNVHGVRLIAVPFAFDQIGRVEQVFELHPGRQGSGSDAYQRHAPDYFLCRCRFKSFRCLCLRIFLRRFLITLPTSCSPCSAPNAERAHV